MLKHAHFPAPCMDKGGGKGSAKGGGKRKLTSREIDEKYINQGRMLGEYIRGERDAPPADMFVRGGKVKNLAGLKAAVAMRNANMSLKGFNPAGRRRRRTDGGVEDTDNRRL